MDSLPSVVMLSRLDSKEPREDRRKECREDKDCPVGWGCSEGLCYEQVDELNAAVAEVEDQVTAVKGAGRRRQRRRRRLLSAALQGELAVLEEAQSALLQMVSAADHLSFRTSRQMKPVLLTFGCQILELNLTCKHFKILFDDIFPRGPKEIYDHVFKN